MFIHSFSQIFLYCHRRMIVNFPSALFYTSSWSSPSGQNNTTSPLNDKRCSRHISNLEKEAIYLIFLHRFWKYKSVCYVSMWAPWASLSCWESALVSSKWVTAPPCCRRSVKFSEPRLKPIQGETMGPATLFFLHVFPLFTRSPLFFEKEHTYFRWKTSGSPKIFWEVKSPPQVGWRWRGFCLRVCTSMRLWMGF